MTRSLRLAVPAALLLLPGLAGAAQLCFAPPSGGTAPGNVPCTPPGPAYDEGWQGYGTTAPEACLLGTDCLPWVGPTVWYLSRSDEAPHFVTGPLPDGPGALYLWLICSEAGVAEAEFSLAGVGMAVTGYTPLNGTSAEAALPDLRVAAADCPTGPRLFGRIDVVVGGATAAGEPAREPWGRVKASYRER